MRTSIGTGLGVCGFGLALLVSILDWQDVEMATTLVIALYVLGASLMVSGFGIAGWGVISSLVTRRKETQGATEYRLYIDSPEGTHVVNIRASPGQIAVDTDDKLVRPNTGAVTRAGGNTTEASTTSTSPVDIMEIITSGGEIRIRASNQASPARPLSMRQKALVAIYRWLIRRIVRMTR